MTLDQFIGTYCLGSPNLDGTANITGWGSNSPALDYVVNQTKPKTIIEVGSWVGASAIHMATVAQDPELRILCVDTFIGSNAALWHERKTTATLDMPQLIQFYVNITNQNLNDQVAAFPITSSAAAELLAQNGVQADICYIDAGHRERDVYADLQDYWPLTKKVLIGDDFSQQWPGVIAAAERFAHQQHIDLQVMDEKFILWR